VTYGSSFGDIDGPDRPIIIGESEDITPVTILHEKRLEKSAITTSSGLGECSKPLLGNGSDIMMDIGRRLKPSSVGRKISGMGYRGFEDHILIVCGYK
jgi:hypothetical protein